MEVSLEAGRRKGLRKTANDFAERQRVERIDFLEQENLVLKQTWESCLKRLADLEASGRHLFWSILFCSILLFCFFSVEVADLKRRNETCFYAS